MDGGGSPRRTRDSSTSCDASACPAAAPGCAQRAAAGSRWRLLPPRLAHLGGLPGGSWRGGRARWRVILAFAPPSIAGRASKQVTDPRPPPSERQLPLFAGISGPA